MATNQNAAAAYPLRSRHTAMLVIHGIGEQNPYATLDSFARGVFRYLQGLPNTQVSLSPTMVALQDWTEVGMRIHVNPGQGAIREGSVDLFEYYWAPETEDKLSWTNTLNWLIRTDLTPLRYFADDLQMITQENGKPRRAALADAVKQYLREILRVVLLYIPLAVGLFWLLAWMSHPRTILASLMSIVPVLRTYANWPSPLVLTCYLLAALMCWFMLQSLGAFIGRRGDSVQGKAELVWFTLALTSAMVLFLVGFVVAQHWHVDLARLWSGIWTLRKVAILAALAAVLAYILTAYVADVAVYVTADAKSKNYEARTAILKGSTEALKRILVDARYDHVILAGHSLGSVIAYDTINELLAQFNGTKGPANDQVSLPLQLQQLQKLRGLVTFGSPLDKIYYFFREHVKEDQAIRAQILSMLHSFRKVPSGRDYTPFKFTYKFDQLEDLVWLNAFAMLDPVSARLKFYEVNDQRSFWYWVPGLAHLRYWGDPDFYSYFIEKLL